MITNIRGSYEQRLVVLKLRTLEDRQVRGDMIETYKILNARLTVKLGLTGQGEGVKFKASKGFLNLMMPPVQETDF